jgi:hypothetical protein
MEVNEAKERGVESMADYDRLFPGAVKEVREWFRTIKTFDGKKENTYLKNGDVIGREETLEIISDCNKQYRGLFDEGKKHDYYLDTPN